jgi:hypothetical protein
MESGEKAHNVVYFIIANIAVLVIKNRDEVRMVLAKLPILRARLNLFV